MDSAGTGYGLVTIVGGFLLLAVIVWATVRNRRARGLGRTEQATRDLRDEINARDTGGGRE